MKDAPDGNAVQRIPLLPPGPGNPRNSEGAFVQLQDGRLLFVYTHFTGSGSDSGTAHLAGRYSDDSGQTWSADDTLVVANEGQQNTMSVSLLRLQDGRIALLYIRKNSSADCVPYIRLSSDEAQSWTEPVRCIEETAYYVVNNDRLVQLPSGRLVVPASRHPSIGPDRIDGNGTQLCALSDDGGQTWRCSRDSLQSGSCFKSPAWSSCAMDG